LVDQKGRLGRKQIMMKPDSDHLFNEELEQLLESLEDKDSDGEDALDELILYLSRVPLRQPGLGLSWPTPVFLALRTGITGTFWR